MTDTVVTRIESAHVADLAAIRALLEGEGLPHADLAIEPRARFWVARDSGRLTGVVGLETYGTFGLLRSLVVATEARGGGLGGRLVEAVEDAARRKGLERLLLLTQTAEKFFSGRGYAVIERTQVPAEVRRSAEFSFLCPASATCMSKTLSAPS